ncbi:MAG TPA: putative metal-dependent hydrolase [Vicinamibacterales bacterium]|nr:putative metal-dependent hydrolase [Vicinamibacterales bacterium]
MDARFPTGKFSFNPTATDADRQASIAAIGGLLAELRPALAAAQLERPYREGGWTARQVVHHLADSHMNAFIRFRLALTEDRPTIKPYDEAAWAKLADATLDPQISVQILDGLHQRWLVMLNAMSAADFAREAVHPDHGPRTLDWFLQLYAWHGRHHIGHLKLTAVGA